jgi:hypothetical protein
MSKAPSSSFRSSRTAPAPPVDRQRQIAEQTAAFLAQGNRITQIPHGVSGQPKLGGPKMPADAGASTTRDTPLNDPA